MLDVNKVYLGDNLDVMKNIEDNTIDSVATDPPYAIGMMSKKWDSMNSKEFYDFNIRWLTECYRVLKPGGYILAFGHSRMSHRLACAVEDVGFEIRDSIAWLYSSGMPKSLNIGKAVDKIQGNNREIVGCKQHAKKDFKDNLFFIDPANKNNTKMFGYGEEIITKGNSEWEGWGHRLNRCLNL